MYISILLYFFYIERAALILTKNLKDLHIAKEIFLVEVNNFKRILS